MQKSSDYPVDKDWTQAKFISEKSSAKITIYQIQTTSVVSNSQSASWGIHYELPWTWTAIEQANARVRREGQQRHVDVHYFLDANPPQVNRYDSWVS